MTTVGDILDEFFSPFSSERLWVMPPTDRYTDVVRRWPPVIDATGRIKAHLATNCAEWGARFATNPAWRPTMSDARKPGAHREPVERPPGTDPDTCRDAFIIYMTSFAHTQTKSLYTCSIGFFCVYTTVGWINCAGKTAGVNYWMYDSMSKRSFGRFARDPAFVFSGMATQYMWWNWSESVDWSTGAARTSPGLTGTGPW